MHSAQGSFIKMISTCVCLLDSIPIPKRVADLGSIGEEITSLDGQVLFLTSNLHYYPGLGPAIHEHRSLKNKCYNMNLCWYIGCQCS